MKTVTEDCCFRSVEYNKQYPKGESDSLYVKHRTPEEPILTTSWIDCTADLHEADHMKS